MPKGEEWHQATGYDRDYKYIKRILSGMKEINIYPKELRNKGWVENFQQCNPEKKNGFIFYYYTPCTTRVRHLSLSAALVKFRKVAI